MATEEGIDTSLLNTSCRILTLSSSPVQAITLIHRVKSRGNNSPLSTPPGNGVENSASSDPEGSSGPIKIPWTISNKYYSAEVHFDVHTVHGLSTHRFLGVPAVMFVWVEGQPYQDDITRISQDMADCEPEVCLAIKVSSTSTPVVSPLQDSNEDAEDDGDIDAFLSSYGFEYIDATKELSKSLDSEGMRIHSEGIPRLPRVLDALSTIMWPSMRANSKEYIQRTDGQSKQRGLLDWSQSSIGNSISTIEDVVVNSRNQPLDGVEGVKFGMRELARWLEEDNLLQQDPWQSAASTGAISMSPISAEFKDGVFDVDENKGNSASGFDDDFTVFVSAPPAEPTDQSGGSSPEKSPWNPSAFLVPAHDGDLYRSLGSVSDFGGSDDEKQMEEVEDIDLPTQAEIQATSSRIFGTSALTQPPTLTRDSTLRLTTELRSLPPEPIIDAHVGSPVLDTGTGGVDDEPYDMAPFDLARVLSALQEMKAEIANMEDEGERRKAAAKVALGLVYGLEADAGAYST